MGWTGEGGDREGEREREACREGGARAKAGNQLVAHKIEHVYTHRGLPTRALHGPEI